MSLKKIRGWLFGESGGKETKIRREYEDAKRDLDIAVEKNTKASLGLEIGLRMKNMDDPMVLAEIIIRRTGSDDGEK